MKFLRVRAHDFLSFADLDLKLDGQSIVVTGPNAAGKTNLGRAVDVVRTIIGSPGGRGERLDLYSRASRHGTTSYEVLLDLELDQPWEHDLVAAFVRSAYVCGVSDEHARTLSRDLRDQDVRQRLDPDSLKVLHRGTLRVSYDRARHQPWNASWEFTHEGATWHIQLIGGSGVMVPGHPGQPSLTRISTFGDAWTAVFPDPEAPKSTEEPCNQPPAIDFGQLLDAESEHAAMAFHFNVPNDGSPITPASVLDLGRVLGDEKLANRGFDFAGVLDAVLQRSVVLTDNQRLPQARQFALQALTQAPDLRDGSQIAGELYRLKNGPLMERERFEEIRSLFQGLTGCTFDVQSSPAPEHGNLLIDVTIPQVGYEQPLAFAGAGRQEALLLSTLLVGAPGRVVVLDEPAAHLEPTLQRRLVQALEGRAQCIVITHSPGMVAAAKAADLTHIVRLAPGRSGTAVFRTPSDLSDQEKVRWLQRLGQVDVRGLLFAAGVVLFEGATDFGALGAWWELCEESAWVTPSASNIALVDVGGQTAFGTYINFLDAFGIPWAIVADGPALHWESHLHQHLQEAGRLPTDPPDAEKGFDHWQTYWKRIGVHTLATSFGVDGSKSGEVEAWFEKLDPEAYRQAKKENARSKPRAGAAFATACPAPPEALQLYRAIRTQLTKQSSPQ